MMMMAVTVTPVSIPVITVTVMAIPIAAASEAKGQPAAPVIRSSIIPPIIWPVVSVVGATVISIVEWIVDHDPAPIIPMMMVGLRWNRKGQDGDAHQYQIP
jgi:heme/copper-type cytochrome/quinol oxidase subunit 2